jgi:hypothetical protein
MYVLSVVAGIFLPLDFLTGLWGVNLSDVPQLGFPVFAIGLIALASLMALFFVRSKWLRPIRNLDGRQPRAEPVGAWLKLAVRGGSTARPV